MTDRRNFIDEVLQRLALRSGASASVDRGRTGRILDYHEPHQIQADLLSAEWMRLNSLDQMMSHEARKRFESALLWVPTICPPSKMFRGRHFDPSDPDRNISTSFGPPPAEKCEIGRYNSAGQPVLYLSSTEAGVRAEIQAPLGRTLMSHAFAIPAEVLIADLTRNDIDPLIANAFDRAEHTDSTEYFRSNVLAHLVSSRFQGMLVPGARGTRDNQYSNLVIFSPRDLWPNWLEPASAPRELE